MQTSTVADQNPLTTVQGHIAQAMAAIANLNSSSCTDLSLLLRLASSEAERVIKTTKKALAKTKETKTAKKAAKAPSKKAVNAAPKLAVAASKSSKKARVLNGAVQ